MKLSDNVKEFIYGKTVWRCMVYDTALKIIEQFDGYPFSFFKDRDNVPPDFETVYNFLQEEGHCVLKPEGVHITEKGKLKLLSGGYSKDLLRKRISFLGIVVGIIASAVGILIYFL